jgi:hypothetical protein
VRGSEALEGGGSTEAVRDAEKRACCSEGPGHGSADERRSREPGIDGFDETGPRITVDRWFLHGVWS